MFHEKPTLRINQLMLEVFLGWPESERKTSQSVYLDAEFFYQTPPSACTTDDLADTLCYQHLIDELRAFLDKKHFRLLEHLAHVVYEFIRSKLTADIALQLTITKYPDIMGLTEGVSFSYGDHFGARHQ